MLFATISSGTRIVSRNPDRFSAMPLSPSPVTTLAATESLPVERASFTHRAMVQISSVIIMILLGTTCILWVYPAANQLAEWAGASYKNAIYIGLGAMLESIPFVLVAIILIWRRTARLRAAA